MIDAPGTEDAAYLSFCILDRTLELLVAKGILTTKEVVTLLGEVASDFGKDSRAVARRNAGYVRDTMIPKHKINE